jgi:hypothetical protein
MPLFRDENPALGPTTSLKELSGFGTGTPSVNYYKPTTREFITLTGLVAASPTSGWLYVAPWALQVVAAKVVYTTAGGAGATINITKVQQAAQPIVASTADNGTTVRNLISAPIALTGAANTVFPGTVNSAAAGSPLILAAGDMVAYQLSGTLTGLAGGYFQVEIAQIG